MSIQAKPHFEISAQELAAWIEDQGADCWWNVDGDTVLTSRIPFPCPGDELATELRRIGRTLLVPDKNESSGVQGTQITKRELDHLVRHMGDNVQIKGEQPGWTNDRLLFLAWKGSNDEWLLVEDEETSESYRAETAALREPR